MFSDFDDKKHLLPGLKENRNVRPVVGIALPGLEMRSLGNCQQYLRLTRAHKPRIVLTGPAQGDFAAEGHSVDESNLSVGVRLGLPLHASPVSDLRFVGCGAHKQHQSHHQSQHHHHQQPPPPSSFFSEKGLHCCQLQASIIPYLLEFVNNSCTPFHATGKQREPSSLLDESGIHMVALFDIGEQGSDSVQGAGMQIILQAMTCITRWLAQGTKTEGVIEQAVRQSFIGKFQHNIC
ncbi:unnamed protein product [Sphagnum compactum]